jgi:hypothetical protein
MHGKTTIKVMKIGLIPVLTPLPNPLSTIKPSVIAEVKTVFSF